MRQQCTVGVYLSDALADAALSSRCVLLEVHMYMFMQDGHFRFVNGDNIGSRCTIPCIHYIVVDCCTLDYRNSVLPQCKLSDCTVTECGL